MQQFGSIVDPSKPEQDIGLVLQRLSGGRQPTRILCTGHSLGGAMATLGQDLAHAAATCFLTVPHNITGRKEDALIPGSQQG